ncbi:TPA: aminoacyltransferase [Streptococcus suis]|nr:aminoacyltransferase [Streptococcus suis]
MNYTYKFGISPQEHDDFVKKSDQTNLFQSSSWAKIKDNWGNERIGFYKDGQLVACASILIRPLPLGFSMLYIPRGPIMDYTNKELVSFVLKTLKKFGKSKRALFVKFDPYILLSHRQIDQEPIANTQAQAIIANLQEAGCEWIGLTTDMAENIQPRFQANIYAKDFSFDNLPKKTRQFINASRNKGVIIQFGAEELLPDFARLMKKTEARKGINLRGLDYYKKLLETYPEQSFVTMASIHLPTRISVLEKQEERVLKEKASFTEKTRQTKIDNTTRELKRLADELDFLREKLALGRDTVALAGTITLNFDDTSENIYAGMDDDFKHYQAAINVWYETAQHAFDHGSRWQNMGGIENDLSGGLYYFKSKFNPVIEEFIGEFNLPVNTLLYKLSSKLYTLRKQLRNKN